MKRSLVITVLLIFISFFQLEGQETDVLFSGDFNDVPFIEFVEQVEKQTGTTFYFLNDWVRGIRVTISGEEISLQRTLDRTLLPTGITYFLDKHQQVFLSNKVPIVTSLPEYSGVNDNLFEAMDAIGESELTSTEKKYIEGRRAGMLETLRVGSSEGVSTLTNAVLYGKMTDVETGEPLIGATIYIEELKKGAATDVDGRFSIVVRPGKYTVDFNCMGMETKQNYLEVLSGGDLSISLERSLIPITEVVIQANRYHNVRGTQMGFDRLNYKVMKDVPVVMGEKDVLKVIQMLPGVQSVGEGAGGFNVRGSSADQNMIYVNKVPVYNSSHLFGFFTSFSPDIVKDFTLYKSNLPAKYGGRLASFFDISTRQGNMNEYTARGGISPVTGRLAVEGPIKKDKSAFVLSARSTYSDWILNQLEDPDLRNSEAGFFDLAGALTWEPGEKTLIKAFAYISRDRFTLGTSNQYSYSNAGASVNIRHRFSSRIAGDMALVYGEYDFANVDMKIPSESYSHEYRIGHYELKADFTWLSLGSHKLTYGANAIFYNLDRGTLEPYGPYSLRAPVELGVENGIETAVYLADEIVLGPRLTAYTGLRYAVFMALGPEQVMVYGQGQPRKPGNVIDTLFFDPGQVIKTYSSLEPRLALNYMLGTNNSLKLSYNRMRQFLFMLSNTIAISPTDQWKLCDYHITPPYVDQVSVGYYQDIPRKSLTTSLEIYHKWVSGVVDYRDGASFISSPHIETEILQGNQKAYGVEAMIKKSTGRFNGWLAYSYSRSIIRIDSPIPGENINEGNPYASNYDRPHNLSLVTNYKMNRRLSFSANLVYITGRPVTYPISIYYVEELQFIDYSARNSYRIPDYFRADFSVNLEGNLKERKFLHSYWMLNIYNLTGRKNAYSVYFINEDGLINGYKLSIFGRPVVTLSWNFKLGNYASE
ncbi:MAG: TonB-dependent receptor [Bacteroidales bacterium]|nr:TonB-dependent receptor [Bacteroidales bacterium]